MSEELRPTPAIQITNVVKLFDHGLIRALDGVTMTVEPGEFVAVTGPSGCGKSTLLHLIAALDGPTSGEIIVNGHPVLPAANDGYRRSEVGFVFQFHNLLPHLNALENVKIAMFGNGMRHKQQRERARELLAAVGLAAKEMTPPPRLAGGERQRLAIARALANAPPIILADEPTGNLDSDSAEMILALFRHIQEEHPVTIVLVTHDMQVASAADRTIRMRDGLIIEDASAPTRQASS